MLLTYKVQVLTEPNNRNPIAESKGVHREVESEGSRRQKFDKTNRNLIQGLFPWVIELRIKTPDSYTEGKEVNQACRTERATAYPGRSLRVP